MAKILICDDDKEIVHAITVYLKAQNHDITPAYDGQQALDYLTNEAFDLAILDVMMPNLDGLSLTHQIREQQNNIPIIILSAKSQEPDKILGLNLGADDYITKPFLPMELCARVNSQLRRYLKLNQSVSSSHGLQIKGLLIDDETKQVLVEDQEVKLTPIEYNILYLLASNAGKVFSSTQIYEQIWREESIGYESTVAVHIRHIREKIEINPKNPQYLKVVWGIGYKIER